MDQFKEYLNQAIKYRFWISVGLACLFPLIAYFVGTGNIAAEEKKETDAIVATNNGVKEWARGQIYNGTWKKVVDEKKEIVGKDVDASWRKLHKAQAPLLDWPKEVEDTIAVWGPLKWPEGMDTAKVNLVVNDYIQVYPAYVDKVYQSFLPFNPEDGTGIVVAPASDLLLKPAVFDETNPPSLGKVWNAQRKLWVERTMLDIVKKVNDKAKAKTWDQAPIKQILDLEVASPDAQDQKSVAKAETLKEPDDILAPGQVAPVKDTTSVPGGGGGGSGRFGPGGGSSSASTSQFAYISSPTGDSQFITVPVAMKVYIDQERIPDLLVEFQNSPMDIKVKDFELKPPTTPVQKPVKGLDQNSLMGGMGISGRGRDRGTLGGSGSFGPGGGKFGNGMGSMPGYPGAGSNGSSKFYEKKGNSNPYGVGTPSKTGKPGIDKSNETLKNIKDKNTKKDGDEKKDEEEAVTSNPYFNVVEVTIKGQARFYVAPPPLPAPDTSSPGAAPVEAPKPAPAAEAPKAEAPKAEAPKPAEPAKDAPKAETPKAEAPKAESGKAEAPKGEAPKPEDPKAGFPKAETPKDAPKPDPSKPADLKPEAPKPDADKSKDVPAPPK